MQSSGKAIDKTMAFGTSDKKKGVDITDGKKKGAWAASRSRPGKNGSSARLE